MLDDMVGSIADYYSGDEGGSDWPFMAVIKGEIGSGKSAFARNMVDMLH